MIELKNNIINGGVCSASSSTSSNGSRGVGGFETTVAHQYNNNATLNRNQVKLRGKVGQQGGQEAATTPNQRKIRSKSVTFLDEISTDDELLDLEVAETGGVQMNDFDCMPHQRHQQQPETCFDDLPAELRSTALQQVGDLRLMCGALTVGNGVSSNSGNIRGIMKKSMMMMMNGEVVDSMEFVGGESDINCHDLPAIQLFEDGGPMNGSGGGGHQFYSKMVKSQTTPNLMRRNKEHSTQLLQSDL